jgi:hypothetical protein
VFGGSNQTPSGIWMTQPGNYHNMNITIPGKDTDAITEVITAAAPGASTEVTSIKALLPMTTGLLVFSNGGVWQIAASTQGGAITPSTITARAQSFSGISPNVPPLPINNEILFVQEKSSIVRAITYNFFTNIYTGTDLTALSDHLFFGHVIVDWAWSEEPDKILWVVRDDGVFLSLTYLKEQEVYAWSRHDTQGIVESVCTVSEAGRDVLYLVVKRFINGAWTRFIERMASRDFGRDVATDTPADPTSPWCVDCGLQYPRVFPAAGVQPASYTGSNVAIVADTAVFGPGDVGKTFRGGGGIGTCTYYISSNQILVSFTTDISRVVPGDPARTVVPIVSGNWSLTMPTSTVTGLGHLEGQLVTGLVDGVEIPLTQVVSGAITLPMPGTLVTVGLPFTWQFQTLPLNTGAPTTKGRRKNITGATLLLDQSNGVQIGPSFDNMKSMKFRDGNALNSQATPLFTGEKHTNVDGRYTLEGQICLQGTSPVPATILGIVLECLIGDS